MWSAVSRTLSTPWEAHKELHLPQEHRHLPAQAVRCSTAHQISVQLQVDGKQAL